MLGIVCDCEGLLDRSGDFAVCRQCKKTFPLGEVMTVKKLLMVAHYEPASAQQQAPTEDEKRVALRKAAIKLCALKLRVIDIQPQPAPPPPPPPRPTPAPGYVYGTWSTSGTWVGSSPVGNVYVRVTFR